MSEQSKIDADRAAFETHMLGRKHPVFGWISSNWFGRGDDHATYENDYVQGAYFMWQARSLPVGVPVEWRDAVKELFDAKQAKDDFERENPGNSTKRFDACLYRIEAAEDALRALLASHGRGDA